MVEYLSSQGFMTMYPVCDITIAQTHCSYLTERFLFTVFAHCLNTFCKTVLIVPKLYTQVNMTQHWEIYHSHLCQSETLLSKPKLCYQNPTILCQNVTLMTK